MSEIRAEYRPPGRHQGRQRRKVDAVIRIGAVADAGAGINPGPPPLWLTIDEAERIAAELVRSAREARAAILTNTSQETRPCSS